MPRWKSVRCLVAVVALLSIVAPRPARAEEPPVHGQLTTLGEGAGALPVLRVWGTPYEMGYAHGKLCAERVRKLYAKLNALATVILGGPAKVDEAWAQMEPFVAPRYMEEMKGLADGAGVDVRDVHRGAAVPDLSEYHCTFFAAWGKATADGHLHQIRALDYATLAGLQDYAALIVYEPTGRHRFVNVGWLGFAGVVTGMSDQHLALSEIGDSFGEDHETLAGEPMPFLMRRVLEDAGDLTSAVDIFKAAHRTSSYLYLIGDAKAAAAQAPAAQALRTSKDFCEVYGPADHGELSLPNTVFWSMGTDSKWNQKVYDVLSAKQGQISPKVGMEDVMKGLRTGNLHAVHFDVTSLELWVANATPMPDVKPGYDQPFLHWQMK
ncbi:MAG: hypothetical protein HZB16_02365 [Armatimonadetes bacterium]|nr:hypothetical protein [Armatimonadota bacterium]